MNIVPPTINCSILRSIEASKFFRGPTIFIDILVSQEVLKLVSLESYEKARTMDGTPAVYYIQTQQTKSRKLFKIHIKYLQFHKNRNY